jgi:hypothetical protein
MYLIDKRKNAVSKLEEKTFHELGFKERQHLQEWIAKDPAVLGEELLIIQKEFAGFSDTNERLDLLALDKQGNIVVIENKLDDTGRDAVWQVLKYASYCASLSKQQIREIYQQHLDSRGEGEKAEDSLTEFFDESDYDDLALNQGQTQRIVMVSGSYRKEVTSTVLWLLNFRLRIQCFKATPYCMGDQLLLNIEQVIPLKDAEEYVIRMAEKAQDEIGDQEGMKSRHIIRKEFWAQLIKTSNEKTDLFSNVSPSKENWITAGIGMTGVGLNYVISGRFARAELYISRANKEENKLVFDELVKRKQSIEESFGQPLTWDRMDDKKASRVKYEKDGVNIFNRDDWPDMIEFMAGAMCSMEKALRGPLEEINLQLKSK